MPVNYTRQLFATHTIPSAVFSQFLSRFHLLFAVEAVLQSGKYCLRLSNTKKETRRLLLGDRDAFAHVCGHLPLFVLVGLSLFGPSIFVGKVQTSPVLCTTRCAARTHVPFFHANTLCLGWTVCVVVFPVLFTWCIPQKRTPPGVEDCGILCCFQALSAPGRGSVFFGLFLWECVSLWHYAHDMQRSALCHMVQEKQTWKDMQIYNHHRALRVLFLCRALFRGIFPPAILPEQK